MSFKYEKKDPITVLEHELEIYLETEPRKDPEMRFSILMSQIGSLSSHMNHDPNLNPNARSYQTKAGEEGDYGHAVAQILVYGISRGLSIEGGLGLAMRDLREKGWQKKLPVETGLGGVQAGVGTAAGPAFVDLHCLRLDEMPEGSILVTTHPTCDQITPFIHKIAGIITDHGGLTCHAAMVAREKGIPCMVGTGNGTVVINPGDWVAMSSIDISIKRKG